MRAHNKTPAEICPVRVDRIHADKYAAIGLAVLDREPVAFWPDVERCAIVVECPIARHLPPALRLSEVFS